jgi:hypothetical protein
VSGGFNYNGAAQMADGLLKYFGVTATITRRVEGAYDAATSKATIKESRFSATAVVLDIKDKRSEVAALTGERRVLVTPKANYEPMVGDNLKIGSTEYQVKQVDKVAPSGVTVIYDLAVSA